MELKEYQIRNNPTTKGIITFNALENVEFKISIFYFNKLFDSLGNTNAGENFFASSISSIA